MSKPWLVGSLVVCGMCPWASAQSLSIEHTAVACATAGKYPKIEVRFSPADALGAARVVFQGRTTDWYSVAMKVEAGAYTGVLPKPNKDLKSFRYYVEATDKSMGTSRTEEFTTDVVESAGACRGRLMAGALSTASIVLQGPAGAAALPAGFAPAGVIAGSAAGSSAAVGAGASAAGGAGGGIGATALVVGGLAAAGGVAVVATKSGGDSSSSGSGSGSNSNPTQNIKLDVSIVSSSTSATGPISGPFINVSACQAGLTFGGGSIFLRQDGTFDDVWNPPSEQVLRVTGRGDANSLQASLACVNGNGPTGSLAATGSGYTMSGTFAFGPSQGTISVRRAQ